MRGVVDPISLGFILSAVIFGVGVSTSSKVEGDKITKAKSESSQEMTVQHVTAPKVQEGDHAIYAY